MTRLFHQSAGALALAASFAMAVPQATAADLPAHDAAPSQEARAGLPDLSWSSDVETVERYRRYGRYGGYRHRDRVDAGDVLAGILIIGTIAAVADAASKSSNRSRERDDDYRRDNRRSRDDYPRYQGRYDDQPSAYGQGYGQSNEIDRAARLCLDEAGREAARRDGDRAPADGRINSVTARGEGWDVTGVVSNYGFSCATTGDGRIDYVRVGDSSASADDDSGQPYSFAQ